ncbi:drug resistance transporter, EmrB/QacA subfamily [Dehalogenimonas formicexedens]|uniref:Drug resistance transporter, EmrB/QacA subfamily n=1 Tax=Dehalogenimonas formicexedens TaxID=1839801 RepID=A0A1P8F4W3_9CHLR|nr:MFS transporter [Dehalogenimonas formicexedens]APV43521.1 drug resistance transporter, EmrB/QacA subfamily [Dehalogenimonas formicexedens]
MLPHSVLPPAAEAKARRGGLIAAIVASFLTPFMGASVNIALPPIGLEFSLDAVTLGWVATAYILAAAVFLLPFGRLADIIGRRKVFIAGLASYTVTSILVALVHNGGQLIVMRVFQGVSGALLFGTGMAILTSIFPPSERGKVLGLNAAAVYIGLSIGPTVGGVITDAWGWRGIFLLNAGLAFFALVVVLTQLKTEFQECKGEAFDLKGAIVYGLALCALMLGFSELPDNIGFILLVVGAGGLAAFVWFESRIQFPLLSVKMFRHNTVFAMSNAASLINYAATFAVGFLLSLYLQFVKGFSPTDAGLVLVAQPVVMALISPWAGRSADRLGPRFLASLGMAISAIGLAMFIFIGNNTSMVYVIAGLVILGAGFGLFSSPNTSAVMGSVERRQYGVASATLGTTRLVGQMLSLGIAMLLFSLIIGHVRISGAVQDELVSSLRVAFAIFTGLCIVGVFASLARGTGVPVPPPPASPHRNIKSST